MQYDHMKLSDPCYINLRKIVFIISLNRWKYNSYPPLLHGIKGTNSILLQMNDISKCLSLLLLSIVSHLTTFSVMFYIFFLYFSSVFAINMNVDTILSNCLRKILLLAGTDSLTMSYNSVEYTVLSLNSNTLHDATEEPLYFSNWTTSLED